MGEKGLLELKFKKHHHDMVKIEGSLRKMNVGNKLE